MHGYATGLVSRLAFSPLTRMGGCWVLIRHEALALEDAREQMQTDGYRHEPANDFLNLHAAHHPSQKPMPRVTPIGDRNKSAIAHAIELCLVVRMNVPLGG